MAERTTRLTEEERQDAAEKYFSLAVQLAKAQRLPSDTTVQVNDLISAASEALASSLHTYNPSYNTPLSFWIARRVRYALLDYLRSLDPLTQEQRKLVNRVRQAEGHLERQLQRKPTSAEIATRLEWDEERVQTVLREGNLREISSEELEEGVPLVSAQPTVLEAVERRLKAEALRGCLADLPEQEGKAVEMRFEGNTFEEIAGNLQLSTPETARRAINRGLKKLVECMQRKGWNGEAR